eukprot:3029884-Prymnesium_polylepis.1
MATETAGLAATRDAASSPKRDSTREAATAVSPERAVPPATDAATSPLRLLSPERLSADAGGAGAFAAAAADASP